MLAITRNDRLAPLLAPQPYPAITITIPTTSTGVSRLEAPIRIHNLASSIERQLIDGGMRPSDARAFLDPVRKFATAHDWMHQDQGLALFLSADGFWTFSAESAMDERAIVGRRFFIRPLLASQPKGVFYVLQFDLQHARFLRADSQSIEELHIPNMPRSLHDVIPGKHPQKQHREHSGGPAWRAGSQITHGSVAIQDEEKEQIAQFCHALERSIRPVWLAAPAPVVLAGVPSTTDCFRRVSHLEIAGGDIGGSTKALSDAELRTRAIACLADRFDAPKAGDLERYRSRLGTGLASANLEEVVKGAIEGRVQALFLRAGAVAWGRYQTQTGQVHRSAEQGAGDEELLNLAAIYTLNDGGRVYEMSAREMPGQSGIAAVYRY